MPTTMTGQNRRLDRCRIETTRFSGPEYQRRMARIIQCSMGGGLARIIHGGSSRNRQAALRERRAEPGGPEAYSCSTSRDQGASPPTEGVSEQRIGDCSRSAHE